MSLFGLVGGLTIGLIAGGFIGFVIAVVGYSAGLAKKVRSGEITINKK